MRYSPKILAHAYHEIVRDMKQDDLVSIAKRFSRYLRKYPRKTRTAVTHELQNISNDELGILNATVTSAHALSSQEEKKIIDTLIKKYNKKNINLVKHVDPELISGVRFTVGWDVVDNSLRARLYSLSSQLG